MRNVLLTVGIVAFFAAGVALGGPVGWRTDGLGYYADANPPTKWSAEENVLWKTPMPSWGNATPVVVGDKLLVCSEPTDLLCVSVSDGKILWRQPNDYFQILSGEDAAKAKEDIVKGQAIEKQIAQLRQQQGPLRRQMKNNKDEKQVAELKAKVEDLDKQIRELAEKLKPFSTWMTPPCNGSNGYSSPTPVTDGKLVWAVFGNGVVSAHDLDGNRKWIKFLAKPVNGWGQSVSPVLVGGKLIVHIGDLFALDPTTGEQLWRIKSNHNDIWGTPYCTTIGGKDVVIGGNGDVVVVADGTVLARGISKLKYGSPIVVDGIVYFAQNGGRARKLPTEASEKAEFPQLWQATMPNDRYYASSVVHEGLVYSLTQKSILVVLDAASGQIVYQTPLGLGGTAYPSITLAGKYIYVSSDTGVTVVMEPGRQFKEIFRNKLERFRSSPVFIGDRLYIRGYKNLYCIGGGAGETR